MPAWSAAVGAFLCAVYDCFRLPRRYLKTGKAFLFLSDLLFCLFSSAVFAVLFFNLTNGRVRVHAFAFAAAGFCIWRKTAGRVLAAIVCRAIDKLAETTGFAARAARKRFVAAKRSLATSVYCRGVLKKAGKGFGHTPVKAASIKSKRKNKNEKFSQKAQ